MPKAEKERVKHAASLASQIENDKDPQVSVSKRAKRKRKAEDDEEAEEKKEQIIEGKLGRQILTMAREQIDEEEEQDSEQEDEMKWRESQVYIVLWVPGLMAETREWKKIPTCTLTKKSMRRNTMQRT
jgi:hypothetical protein